MKKSPIGLSGSLARQSNFADVRRLEPTPAEAELESILNHLGNGALVGEFKREWPIGDWIVDFYFPDIKLAIEVDGGYHRAQSRWRKDAQKTADLNARGITVLRLVNAEVLGDRERLIARLRAAWRAAQQNMAPRDFSIREPEAPLYLVCSAFRTYKQPYDFFVRLLNVTSMGSSPSPLGSIKLSAKSRSPFP